MKLNWWTESENTELKQLNNTERSRLSWKYFSPFCIPISVFSLNKILSFIEHRNTRLDHIGLCYGH